MSAGRIVFNCQLIFKMNVFYVIVWCFFILKLLRGSHKCGRLDHSKEDGQFSPSNERLEFLKSKLVLDVVEMKPGEWN